MAYSFYSNLQNDHLFMSGDTCTPPCGSTPFTSIQNPDMWQERGREDERESVVVRWIYQNVSSAWGVWLKGVHVTFSFIDGLDNTWGEYLGGCADVIISKMDGYIHFSNGRLISLK